ncbi:hypothetical protein KCP70_16960 [Salmonella enterica subsp. enterica]|nr:hypothetical protein KCP70_16960 [Salmonella enterica subsp. enterica]
MSSQAYFHAIHILTAFRSCNPLHPAAPPASRRCCRTHPRQPDSAFQLVAASVEIAAGRRTAAGPAHCMGLQQSKPVPVRLILVCFAVWRIGRSHDPGATGVISAGAGFRRQRICRWRLFGVAVFRSGAMRFEFFGGVGGRKIFQRNIALPPFRRPAFHPRRMSVTDDASPSSARLLALRPKLFRERMARSIVRMRCPPWQAAVRRLFGDGCQPTRSAFGITLTRRRMPATSQRYWRCLVRCR